ncbi:MAG: cell division protein ZapA [Pseudobutyrivibrio sp.]|nr:cell division protein ZapA [Pseudobutyrivibrio sp.]
MISEKSAKVLIGGKVYTLSGYEEEEYLQKVANYINAKLDEFNAIDSYKRIPADLKATLLELNIADDYFKAKNMIESLEADLEIRDKEIYDLKHDLISAQLKAESVNDTLKKLESENKELLLNKTRLEASLADALLGSDTLN